MFKTNVGGTDRILRIVVGLVLIAGFFAMPTLGLRWVLLVVGVVALLTGVMRSCLMYQVLGINTCPLNK
jgi:hypothetical protein